MRVPRFAAMLLMSVLLLVFSTSAVYAGTINVTSTLDNGTNCTLREAIAEANAVGAGGASLANGCSGATAGANTINLLSSGTYTIGSILPDIVTTITIQASSGTPTIQANANPNVATYGIFSVRTASGDLTLVGLIVRNGSSSGAGTDGGCITAFNSGSVSLNNTIVERCYGDSGGGVFVLSGALSITNNSIIRFNQASDSGGGAYAQNSSLTITSSTISDNVAANLASSTIIGGGLASLSNSPVSISGSTFSNNTASGASNSLGGSMYLTDINGAAFSISGSAFTGNTASSPGRGGAIYYVATAAGASLSISSSRFQSNTAGGLGDALYNGSSGSTSITGSCFTNNGDTALYDTASSGVVTANGGGNVAQSNWWGTSWGPRIEGVASNTSAYVSNGDSINGNGNTAVSNQLVDVDLTTNPTGSSQAPTGAWLTTPPTVAGATCQTCVGVSSISHGRTCS